MTGANRQQHVDERAILSVANQRYAPTWKRRGVSLFGEGRRVSFFGPFRPRSAMSLQNKQTTIKVLERQKDGGRIVISTGGVDRDKDRVFPQGAKLDNYRNNPVVLWGHDYYSPSAIIGRARAVEASESGLVADFELREAANDQDPQHIVRLLWEQDFVRAASIGFRPESAVSNDFGGLDFVSWELLEFSLVSVPANADALRLAAKQFPQAYDAYEKSLKRGARHSVKDQESIQSIHDAAAALGAMCAEEEADDGKVITELRGLVRVLQKQTDDLSRQNSELAQTVARLALPPVLDPSEAELSAVLDGLKRLPIPIARR